MAFGITVKNRSPNGFQRCPLEGLCLLSSFHESKCPPRHEGQALRQQKLTKKHRRQACARKNTRRSRTKKHRASESALKMPADRRDSKTDFQMKPGEWAFSMERLMDSFRFRSQGSFPKNGFQRCPLEGLCFLSSFHERKCPPRHEGHACANRNPMRGYRRKNCTFKINIERGKLRLRAHRGKLTEEFTLLSNDQKQNNYPPGLRISPCTSKSNLCGKSIKKKSFEICTI